MNNYDKNKNILNNAGAERAVLSGIIKYGSDLFIDIEYILSPDDFWQKINRCLFGVLKYLVHKQDVQKFDTSMIIPASKFLGYDILTDNRGQDYIESLMSENITQDNTLKLASVVGKLSVCRKLCLCVKNVRFDLFKLNGSEDINEIIDLVESPIFNLTSELTSKSNEVVELYDSFKETIDTIASTPQDIVGLPTKFSVWDECIGGGLRPASVNVIGARPKIGKSAVCLNIAHDVAKSNIPVLYLDTELTKMYQMMRLASLDTGININRIETGKFAETKEEYKLLMSSCENIKKHKIMHCNIAGQSIHSVLSIARRWLVKSVGFNPDGTAKPCLIIYDYIKLMDMKDMSGSMKEYQLLGFFLTEMHNFCVKWNLPILATIQLNRDNDVSQSDRIEWLCSNMTILQNKTSEDFQSDPISNGDKKLIVKYTRFGPGMDFDNYINIKSDYSIMKMEEGSTKSYIDSSGKFKGNEKIIHE